MHNKTLKDIFEDKYSELPELLENNGITTLALLNKKVFNENGMYFFEILGYDKKDNERIKNILRMENTEDVLEFFIVSSVESRFGSGILKPVIFLLIVLILILVFIIFLFI